MLRARGVTPATVAVIDGAVRVGASADDIERLARAGPARAHKVSRRDLAWVVAGGRLGTTTVAGTVWAAHRAGIPLMATGGLGGVHRGADASWDVSADLRELGRTPVAVVCAGIKSILDVPRTLEVLETEGVMVAVYGRSEVFPGFYTRDSGCSVQHTLEDASACARSVEAMRALHMDSGAVIAVPIPEEHEADGRVIASAIDEALRAAADAGIRGSRVTPFVLHHVNSSTGDVALEANAALYLNNVCVCC